MEITTGDNVAGITVFITNLVFGILAVFLLLHGKNHRETPNRLAANLLIGDVFFAVIYYSAIIHTDVLKQEIHPNHCRVSYTASILGEMFVVTALFMLTIDRLIFIKNPINYTQKMPRGATIAMLVMPWVVTVVCLIVRIPTVRAVQTTVLTDEWYDIPRNKSNLVEVQKFQVPSCHMAWHEAVMISKFLYFIIFLFVSVACFVAALIMWCCYKRHHKLGTDYAVMGAEVVTSVRHSVILVSLSNCVYILMVLLNNSTFLYFVMVYRLAMLGMLLAIVIVATFENVRESLNKLCCKCCKGEDKEASVRYKTETEEEAPMSP